MNTIKLGRWEIEFDPVATSNSYTSLPDGTGCSCESCQNFSAATEVAFPPEFKTIAHTLGIDLRKPVELTHYERVESGLHFTGGWFHIIGNLLSGADAAKQTSETSWSPDLELLTPSFQFGITTRLALVSPPFKAHPVMQLEFHTYVPWLISAPEPD